MRFEWIDLHLVSKEVLPGLEGSKIEKVYVTSKEQVLLCFYGEGQKKFLKASFDKDFASLFQVPGKGETPSEPSAFCSQLRKYLESSRLRAYSLAESDRVLKLDFERAEERCSLVFDFRGPKSNLYLLDERAQVLGCLAQKDIHDFAPKQEWAWPETMGESLFEMDEEQLQADLESLSSREVLRKIRELTPSLLDIYSSHEGGESLKDLLQSMLDDPYPHLMIGEMGPEDYSFLKTSKEGCKSTTVSSVSETLRQFFEDRKTLDLLKKVKARVLKGLDKEEGFLDKKLERLQEKLKEYENFEEVEKLGSLLNAQRDRFVQFQKKVRLFDFYNDDREIEIEVDPRKSLQANIDSFFKKARKFKRGIEKVEAQIQEVEELRKLIQRVRDQVRHESDFHVLEDQQQSLEQMGLLAFKQKSRQVKKSRKSSKKARKTEIRMFYSSEGAKIYAGRNDSENDTIVRQLGSREDLWFHVEGNRGAHVLLKHTRDSGKESEREAAQLAAFFSGRKYEAKALVMYTEIKNVKKLQGMAPGQVKVGRYNTISVRLDSGILRKLEKNRGKLLKDAKN